MFGRLFDRLRAAFAGVPPEFRQRLGRIDKWVEDLPLAEARALANGVLANPEWFHTQPGDGSAYLTTQVPATVREFYGHFLQITGRFCDMRLVASESGRSETEDTLLRIGWDDSHTELCTLGAADRVYRIANDMPGDDAREGSVPSIYHAIVRVSAVLEYLPVPPAAA